MGFWIFMLAMGLLFPAVMILFGAMFMRSAPKKINFIFGYRTDMSMKNRDTWEFAHKYMGKMWFRLGLLLIPVTVIAMLFVIGKTENTVGTVGLIVSFINTVVLIVPVFFTEKALNKAFDKNGGRKAESDRKTK